MTAAPTSSAIALTATIQVVATNSETEGKAAFRPSSAGIWVGVILLIALSAGIMGARVSNNDTQK
jgi:hypothetical protein